MRNIRGVALIAVFLIALAGLPAGAQEPLARVSVGEASVDWTVGGTHERLVLTVSDPEGTVTRQEYKSGSAPSFSLFDAKGNKRFDGVYSWELQGYPVLSASTKERLAESRKTGDATVELELRRAGLLPPVTIQAGAFSISGGAFIQNDLAEDRDKENEQQPRVRGKASASGLTPMFEKDQVIPDDLIVQGSGCFGFDCVNNESFGFDTIRMKENNTRIKFEDTSVGTFPTNDWQLTANDSASGGLSKFSIEDITGAKVPFTVEAGAATNSIYVDSTGRLGLRTSTPVLDVHVATSNTPGIRLEQNNAGGFTAQTWDIAGNEANFFVRDVTGGSRLPFRIRPGAPTSSVDIGADGQVGVGTASATAKLHVVDDAAGASVVRLQNTNAAGFSSFEFQDNSGNAEANFGIDNANSTLRMNSISGNDIVMLTESTERLRLDSDGDVGINCNNPASDLVIASGGGCSLPSSSINAGAAQFTVASSRTFKQNLSPVQVPDILEKIADIGVYTYDFIQGPKDRLGLMAEDFHKVFGRGSDKFIDGGEVQTALWLAVQQLTAQNKALTERLAALESQVVAEKVAKAAQEGESSSAKVAGKQ